MLGATYPACLLCRDGALIVNLDHIKVRRGVGGWWTGGQVGRWAGGRDCTEASGGWEGVNERAFVATWQVEAMGATRSLPARTRYLGVEKVTRASRLLVGLKRSGPGSPLPRGQLTVTLSFVPLSAVSPQVIITPEFALVNHAEADKVGPSGIVHMR